jgi:hypothetical protein
MRLERRGPFVSVATLTVAGLVMAGCASGVTVASSDTASPSAIASASASSSSGPALLTVEKVVAHIGTAEPNRQTSFASGHWLYPNDVNNTIVYDGNVVVHGHPVTAVLSDNGLHYAYTLAAGLSIYVDGHAVATGTHDPKCLLSPTTDAPCFVAIPIREETAA